MLLSLKTLDDELVIRKEKSSEEFKKEDDYNQHNQCPFDDDWQLINKCLEEGVGPPEEKLAINGNLKNIKIFQLILFIIIKNVEDQVHHHLVMVIVLSLF